MQALSMPLRLLLLAFLLAGCASEASKPDYEAQEESIDQILSEPLGEAEYTEGVRCLPVYSYNSVDILDNRHVVFKGTGGRLWLNRLRNRCTGLRRNDTLKFDVRASQLCSLDTFEAISLNVVGPTRTSATCSLGEFMPITKEQLDGIKAALEGGAK